MNYLEQLASKYAKSKVNHDIYQQMFSEAFIEGWETLLSEIGDLPVFENYYDMEADEWMVHEIVPKILNDIDEIKNKEV